MFSHLWRDALEARTSATLRELFDKDPNRANRFTVKAAGWTLDYSKNRITTGVMNKLLAIAEEAKVEEWRDRMFRGDKINVTENRAVLHTALRNCSDEPVFVDGKDVMPDVRNVLSRMGDFAQQVRSGKWRGHTGARIKYIVNIGIGGSDLGPAMACEALKPYSSKFLQFFFVSNVDATHLAETLRKVKAHRTLSLIHI